VSTTVVSRVDRVERSEARLEPLLAALGATLGVEPLLELAPLACDRAWRGVA
tara:strand:+ start:2819 stop:2974 length:156 start_codon:yes stop_codon:yes gene_type:complete